MYENDLYLQLKIISLRNPNFTTNQWGYLKRVESGLTGEANFLNFVNEFGHPNWKIFADYWFDDGKRMQADFVIVTSSRWIVVEVKHYDGKFEYKDNECYLNGRVMSDNFFASMDLRVKKIRHMAHQVDSNIVVQGLFVFVHEHCDIEIHLDHEFDFDIRLRHQLKCYFSDLKRSDGGVLEQNYLMTIDRVLDQYRAGTPFVPKAISNSEWQQLTKGINCCTCDNLDMVIHHKTVYCPNCATVERKYDVVLRLRDQVDLLYYGAPKKVTASNIYDLCNKNISNTYIRKVLRNLKMNHIDEDEEG
jgi:hypothetical protein